MERDFIRNNNVNYEGDISFLYNNKNYEGYNFYNSKKEKIFLGDVPLTYNSGIYSGTKIFKNRLDLMRAGPSYSGYYNDRNIYLAYNQLDKSEIEKVLEIKQNIKERKKRGESLYYVNPNYEGVVLEKNNKIIDYAKKQIEAKKLLYTKLTKIFGENGENIFIDVNEDGSFGKDYGKLKKINKNGSEEIIDPRKTLIEIRKEDEEMFDDFFGELVLKDKEKKYNKIEDLEKYFSGNYEDIGFRSEGGFKNKETFDELKNKYLKLNKKYSFLDKIEKGEIEFSLNNNSPEFIELSKKYMKIKNETERKEKLKEDVENYLNKILLKRNKTTNFAHNSLEKNMFEEDYIENKRLATEFSVLVDGFSEFYENIINEEHSTLLYRNLNVEEMKDYLNKKKEFLLQLKKVNNEEKKKEFYMNNLSFMYKTFRNEDEIDNEIKNTENALNYYKSFDGIEGVGNLKTNVLSSLMDEYRNTEWMRGVIIDNVRDGEISENSKQAVNGSQIYHLRKELNDKIDNNTQRIEQVEKRLDQTNKEMRAGIAGVAALNGIPQASLPGQSAIGVGVGNFKGASALAIGISKKTENGKISFKLSGSVNTNKDVSISGGVGYFF